MDKIHSLTRHEQTDQTGKEYVRLTYLFCTLMRSSVQTLSSPSRCLALTPTHSQIASSCDP